MDDTPVVLDYRGHDGKQRMAVVPRFKAPVICDGCRAVPETFKVARKEMEKYFGPTSLSKGFEG